MTRGGNISSARKGPTTSLYNFFLISRLSSRPSTTFIVDRPRRLKTGQLLELSFIKHSIHFHHFIDAKLNYQWRGKVDWLSLTDAGMQVPSFWIQLNMLTSLAINNDNSAMTSLTMSIARTFRYQSRVSSESTDVTIYIRPP